MSDCRCDCRCHRVRKPCDRKPVCKNRVAAEHGHADRKDVRPKSKKVEIVPGTRLVANPKTKKAQVVTETGPVLAENRDVRTGDLMKPESAAASSSGSDQKAVPQERGVGDVKESGSQIPHSSPTPSASFTRVDALEMTAFVFRTDKTVLLEHGERLIFHTGISSSDNMSNITVDDTGSIVTFAGPESSMYRVVFEGEIELLAGEPLLQFKLDDGEGDYKEYLEFKTYSSGMVIRSTIIPIANGSTLQVVFPLAEQILVKAGSQLQVYRVGA